MRDSGVTGRRRRIPSSGVLALVVVATVAVQLSATASGRGTNACPRPAATRTPDGPSARAELVEAGGSGTPAVQMVRYPRPDRPPGGSNPWSQWGQGLVLDDGRFLSALGDHQGRDGNSYLFVYDPHTEMLTRFTDVSSLTRHQPGDWGYGKIHGQIVVGPCDSAWFATYWGTREDIVYNDRYQGDALFRIDTNSLATTMVDIPVARHGIPSLTGLGRGLLYGEAVDPFSQQPHGHEEGAFFVYDTTNRRIVYRSDDASHAEFRNVLLTRRGKAFVAGEEGRLLEYDPADRSLRPRTGTLPGGGFLRASTRPAPDGTVYGVTEKPDMFFALERDGTIRSLGRARGYTASLALDRDGSHFYYVPGAHGDAFLQGTPLISVDTRTGEQHVVVRLDDPAERELGLTLGGSYDVAIDERAERLYVGLNAGKSGDDPWGEVVLAIVDLGS